MSRSRRARRARRTCAGAARSSVSARTATGSSSAACPPAEPSRTLGTPGARRRAGGRLNGITQQRASGTVARRGAGRVVGRDQLLRTGAEEPVAQGVVEAALLVGGAAHGSRTRKNGRRSVRPT